METVDSGSHGGFTPLGNSTSSLVKGLKIRAVVGTVCILSIIGSFLIIMSYLCFKKQRTKAREILVHISIMDMGVAITNIIGLTANFDEFYYNCFPPCVVPEHIQILCKGQAFFAGYATLGSVFWTVSLMTYLYFRILHNQTKHAQHFLKFGYVFCYGFPLFVLSWLLFAGHLGYSPFSSSGWCGLITKTFPERREKLFIALFGSDLWMYLAIFLIPVLYISVRLFINSKVKATKGYATEEQLWSALHNVDYKFLLIPIIFISLRIWGCIDTWLLVSKVHLPRWLATVFYYIAGIGDSGQGFANAILFVFFSKTVRDNFKRCIRGPPPLSPEEKLRNTIEEGTTRGSNMREPSGGSDHESTTTYNEQSSHFNATYGAVI